MSFLFINVRAGGGRVSKEKGSEKNNTRAEVVACLKGREVRKITRGRGAPRV